MSLPSSPTTPTLDLFTEPPDYYPPTPPATTTTYTTLTRTLTLRLAPRNPLWGHLLWNASRVVAEYLEHHAATLVQGKTVLELGAGAGLPSLMCALHGAETVVVTDYPDEELVQNLRWNVEQLTNGTVTDGAGGVDTGMSTGTSANGQEREGREEEKSDSSSQRRKSDCDITVQGFLWGADPSPLLASPSTRSGFDLLILADILFNHSQHGALLSTLQATLKRDVEARALVFFTPYRPWLLEKDLDFFEKARETGMKVTKLFEQLLEEVMFPDDRGDEMLRRTVFAYEVRWPGDDDFVCGLDAQSGVQRC